MNVPKNKTLFMETTEVPAEKTASEISAVLIQAGSIQISTEYHEGQITGLRWVMRVYGRDLLFSMPARVDPIYKIFLKRKGLSLQHAYLEDGRPRWGDLHAKAMRVAWRQLLRWTQAQLAMIECGMVEATEVFMPYLQAASGTTLFEFFKGQEFKQLPEAKH